MNAKTTLRAFHLAAVIGAVPLAFTAMLPSAQQAPKPGASSYQSDRGSSTRSTSHAVRAAASRSAFPIQHAQLQSAAPQADPDGDQAAADVS